MILSLIYLVLFAAPVLVSALPSAPRSIGRSCSLSSARMSVPMNQTQIEAPTTAPSYIALGVGVQNYTCTSSGNYTNVGAVAALYDLSCVYKDAAAFSRATEIAYTIWNAAPSSFTASDLFEDSSESPFADQVLLGEHYYAPTPGSTTAGAVSPEWDFTDGLYKGNSEAYVVGAKTGDLPVGGGDIDWVQLKSVAGELATEIFRMETQAGVAPTSCTPGSSLISVKYTAQYWLYGGSI